MSSEGSASRPMSTEEGNERRMEAIQRRRVSLVKNFKQLHPPTFGGSEGPKGAEEFVQKITKIFTLLGCSEEDKVVLAGYSLEKAADIWWTATKGTVNHQYQGTPWEVFRRAFLYKYFPFTVREDRVLEYDSLRQTEDMTVDEYEARFSELSRYAPTNANDPIKRADKFERGLLPRIRNAVVTLMLPTYEEVY